MNQRAEHNCQMSTDNRQLSLQCNDIYALGIEFENARDLYHAAEKVRDAGYKKWDTYSPFPIHGMDEAMGLQKSWLSALVFIGGLTGFTLAVSLEFGTSSFLYPLVVAGKPTNLFTIPAFFPIMFELTILFSALTATFGMFALNGLPRWNHPNFNWDRFKKVTEDKFFIIIEASDKKFSLKETTAFLNSLGGNHLTAIHEDEEKDCRL
ncbi:MAG: DUF3341 domain-containing protein [Chthoniobacterales bacterium]